jgi:hypothetical protein
MDAHARQLKDKAIKAAIVVEQEQYRRTGNPQHAWHTWQIARRATVPIPAWVATFIDGVAAREATVRTRKTDTAERYERALTAMEVAVAAHLNRQRIRDVAKQLGTAVPVSRRDRPNLTAIAKTVAKEHGVSLNKLLTRYRASVKRTPNTSVRGANRTRDSMSRQNVEHGRKR